MSTSQAKHKNKKAVNKNGKVVKKHRKCWYTLALAHFREEETPLATARGGKAMRHELTVYAALGAHVPGDSGLAGLASQRPIARNDGIRCARRT